METRLQLRRRLLRIEDSSKANSSASPEVLTALKSATSELRLKAFARKQQSNAADDAESDECEDGEDADEDDEGGEEDECVEEDELDTAAASGALNGNSGSTNDTPPPPPKRMDKCETSSVVKLLFSRHDSARSPTICFDYPPHLRTTREYTYQIPSGRSHTSSTSSSGGGSAQVGQHRVVVLNVQDCPLFYKTHWERNCVKNAFAVAGLMRTKKKWTGWHIAWAKHIPKTKFKFFKNDAQHAQVFNHFPDPWVIGRKDRLMRTLASYKRRFGASYSFVPEGFTLPDQMDAFRRAIQREDNDGSGTTSLSSGSGSTGSIWILKPPASACGRGIRVITSKDVESISKERKYVVQKYVANPLLLDGFKFDLRIYVVVTSVDPLRIYLFNEGIARFCTSEYSLEKLKNRFSHLTNYSVNKTNDRFVENTDDNSTADGQGNAGSKWSLTGLLAHLQSRQLLKDPEQLKQQIRDIICKTIIAAEAHLTPLVHQFVKKPVTCYELFGFDVMLDSNLKPWLIEVNVSPSLMGGSPLDKRVKGLLLSDIFHLVGVPVSIDSLPAGMLPKDLERKSDSQSSLSSSSSASTALSKASVPLFSRRRSLGLHTTTAGFRRTSTTPPSLASSSSSSSRAAVNKQLHEVVLDPSVARFENNHLELFTSSDWDMVHAMEDEMDRLGHFERIFPSSVCPEETSKYAPFFTCQRYSNALCAKWISSQLSRSSSGSKARKPSKPKLHQPNQTAKR